MSHETSFPGSFARTIDTLCQFDRLHRMGDEDISVLTNPTALRAPHKPHVKQP